MQMPKRSIAVADTVLRRPREGLARLLRTEPERAADVLPRRAVRRRRTRQPAGDLVELVHGRTDLCQAASAWSGSGASSETPAILRSVRRLTSPSTSRPR